jgi:Raf kinase inhibitor-like YbhB/YbcL family protein
VWPFDKEATFRRNIHATVTMCHRRSPGPVPPEGTRSFLIVCDDPDAPSGIFHHWAAFDIPPHWRGLKEGHGAESLANGFRQAINDFGKPGYSGPCPPPGGKPHHYHFRLNALSEPSLPVGPSATCVEVIALASPYICEFVELVGLYQRSMRRPTNR